MVHWGGLSVGLSLGNISSSFELESNRYRGFSPYQGNMCNSLIRQGCDVNLGRCYRESPAQAYREAVYENRAYEANRVASLGGYDRGGFRGYGGGYGRDGCFGQGVGPCSIFNLGASGLFGDQSGRLGVSGAYQNPNVGWGGPGINVGFNFRNLRF